MCQFSERSKCIFPCCQFYLSLSSLVKGCISEVAHRAQVSELLDSYVGYSFIFTDGLVDGVQCSSTFYAENVEYSRSGKLRDGLSIFTVELLAISQAVAYIDSQPISRLLNFIVWIPDHKGLLGKEKVDALGLAKRGLLARNAGGVLDVGV